MSNEDYNPNSVDAKLSSIEGKIDTLIEKRLDHENRIVELSKRIKKLEDFRIWLAGGFAALVALAKYLKLI